MLSRIGLLGKGTAAVVGLPKDFNLRKKLSNSSSVKIATAFARMSGWRLIRSAVAACKGNVEILAGLDFFQTDPHLLEQWLRLSLESERFSCKIVTANRAFNGTFHPKVLIARGANRDDFAVVGSGNLTAGGLSNNVECGLFTTETAVISKLVGWFDDLYENLAICLTEPEIRKYRPLYESHKKRNRELTQEQHKKLKIVAKEIDLLSQARLRHWRKAVADAKRLFARNEFIQSWRECDMAAQRIRRALDYPNFSFDSEGFQEFLQIKEFGNLGALNLNKKKLLGNLPKLRTTFRVLVHDSTDIRDRLEAVFSGRNKIVGIDRNVVSKILTVHDRDRWPIYNSKTDAALKKYGYELPRGLSKAARYIAYSRLMQQFMRDTGARDMFALDRFLLEQSGH